MMNHRTKLSTLATKGAIPFPKGSARARRRLAQRERAAVWLIHWPNIEPTVRRYQTPVTRKVVMGEHLGALAAEPLT